MNHKKVAFMFTILMGSIFASNTSYASTVTGTIDPLYTFAWSNNDGWINFGATSANVQVTSSLLTGYVWDITNGWINLAPTLGGVTNDGNGTLGGYAWGANTGWISFSGVTIDTNGLFHGTATGVGIGSINFDCTTCAVKTDWRSSSNVTTTTGGGPPGLYGATNQTNIIQVPPTPVLPIRSEILPPLFTPSTPPNHRIQPSTRPPTKSISTESLYVETYNAPLTLKPRQAGKFTQDLPTGGQIVLEVGTWTASDDIVFVMPTSTSTVDTAQSHLDPAKLYSTPFEVSAHYRISKKSVHTFTTPLHITLPIPHNLIGKKDITILTRETSTEMWKTMSDFQVNADTISFYVNHLSFFLIQASADNAYVPSTVVARTEPGQIVPRSNKPTAMCSLRTQLTPYIGSTLILLYVSYAGCIWWPLICGLLFIFLIILMYTYKSIRSKQGE